MEAAKTQIWAVEPQGRKYEVVELSPLSSTSNGFAMFRILDKVQNPSYLKHNGRSII
jgi:hypothetical protein